LTPVRLPPGRLRLGTRPAITGSVLEEKTIGIVEVTRLAVVERLESPPGKFRDPLKATDSPPVCCRRQSLTLRLRACGAKQASTRRNSIV